MTDRPVNYNIRAGAYVHQGGRSYQEDRLVCIKNLKPLENQEGKYGADKNVSVFACFDGHGGSLASDFLSKSFAEEVNKHPQLKMQPLSALSDTWKKMDDLLYNHFTRLVREGKESTLPRDGSTGTVCLVVGEDIYVCNCGDTHCCAFFNDGNSRQMTEDHGTLNKTEITRIESNGGNLKPQTSRVPMSFPFCCFLTEKIVGKPRVWPGGLLVTRAFGNFHAKIASLGGNKDVLICEHGRIEYQNLHYANLRHIVIASDGVWDALSIAEVKSILRTHSKNLIFSKLSPSSVAPEMSTAE